MNIYVGNLPRNVDEDDLKEMFEEYGQVNNVKVIRDRSTNVSKGFGFVEMPDDTAAQEAIEAWNEGTIEGRTIVVSKARPPQRRDRSHQARRFRR
ncbi:MAG: RNA-binding protein [candidate division KSB1 bacterium]|nr:RNA-binding protein [candidate division KSB1 bacterium]